MPCASTSDAASVASSTVRETLGPLGGFLAKLFNEPQSTTAWQQGAKGEGEPRNCSSSTSTATGSICCTTVASPGRGHANIDHLAIGPAGVTVIDSKMYKGKVRVDRAGGLFSPRRSELPIAGRDRTSRSTASSVRSPMSRPR